MNKQTSEKPARTEVSQVTGMRLKIGVMGAASTDISMEYLQKATQLGKAIAASGCVMVTGACPGLPLAAADAARRAGGFVIGISPGLSLQEHIERYGSPGEGHDILVYTGAGLMGREVINIRTSDVVVIIGGRAGTLGEFAIAYDEGKLIGVLRGTGGITSLIPAIVEACNKATGAEILYEDDAEVLVAELIKRYSSSPSQISSCYTSPHIIEGIRTARDVVCGMWLDPNAAAESRVQDGHKFFFCCAACAATFDRDPKVFTQSQIGKG